MTDEATLSQAVGSGEWRTSPDMETLVAMLRNNDRASEVALDLLAEYIESTVYRRTRECQMACVNGMRSRKTAPSVSVSGAHPLASNP